MSTYTITTTLSQPYGAAVEAVRAALGDQGFGVLTEIDLKATLKDKLDLDIEPQILGACRPPLAYEAIQAVDENITMVEAFDPDAMMGLADNAALHKIAADAKQRLNAAFTALNEEN